jgi:uncharacterized membrane protein YfcA
MDFSFIQFLMVAFVALIAGVINTIAGAGSNLVIPSLMLLGVPADIANATNRVGILAQSSSALQGFSSHGKFDMSDLVLILIPTLLGGLIGSLSIASIDPSLVKPVILVTMLTMASITFFKPSVIIPPAGTSVKRMKKTPKAWAALIFVGFYGGLIQAGVGFLLIASIAGILRYDILRTNALKHVCMLAFTSISFIVFLIHGLIDWQLGGILALGYIVGAQIGVRFAIKASNKAIKSFLFLMTLVACLAALLN